MSLDPLSSIVVALKRAKVIPDVIPASLNFQPTVLFSVTWDNGAEVLLGNEIPKPDTQAEPKVSFATATGFEADDSYTFVCTDPDVPSGENPEGAQFRHWVITGLKSPTPNEIERAAVASAAGRSLASANPLTATATKPATSPWFPPTPPPGSGLHRYVFLLFREPKGFSVPDNAPELKSEMDDRYKWDAFQFAGKYGLTLVGANFFKTKED